MSSIRKPTALIIGRNASLGTALGDWLTSTGVDVTFASLQPPVTLEAGPNHGAELMALIESRPAGPPPRDASFDHLLWIAEPPPDSAMGAATAQQTADAELDAQGQIIGQAFMEHPFQLAVIRLLVPADPRMQPEAAQQQRADRAKLIESWRRSSRAASATLKGSQVFLAYVEVDPAGDLSSPPTRYHRHVANILGRALAVYASVKDTTFFRAISISRHHDGDPVVGPAEG